MYGNADRFLRYYAAFWRGQFKGMPLWKKGEATIKQPVFVSDVAQAILNAAREVETNGKTYLGETNIDSTWTTNRFSLLG